MMNIKSFLPPSAISDYVSSILLIESPGKTNGFVVPLYANGSPTIIFLSAKATSQRQNAGHLMLYGQTLLPDELLVDEPFTLIAYFLHPHTLKSLFGLDASELTNGSIDLNYLAVAKEINLQEQLLNEQHLEARLKLMNDFILKVAASNIFDYSKILFATNELKANTGVNALTDLQKKLNTTERSLQRLFESQAGISPRMFKRVWQFHAAFQQLNEHQFSKLTDIAYEHGFADQSHFVRVFKEFTGLTPSEYLEKAAPYNPKF
jgi:AraC-like DNA-binding protein